MPTLRCTIVTAVALAPATMLPLTAGASAPPVGPLPPGHVSSIVTHTGDLVAVALPHRPAGRVWRIARSFDGAILSEVSEADVGQSVVIVFRAAGAGKTTLAYGLTSGERTKAYESRTYDVTVR